jgi:hypothetical protein
MSSEGSRFSKIKAFFNHLNLHRYDKLQNFGPKNQFLLLFNCKKICVIFVQILLEKKKHFLSSEKYENFKCYNIKNCLFGQNFCKWQINAN